MQQLKNATISMSDGAISTNIYETTGLSEDAIRRKKTASMSDDAKYKLKINQQRFDK